MHRFAPGGGLTANPLRWVRVPNREFLVPPVKLAARFKGRLKAWLQAREPELYKQVPAKVGWVKLVADSQPVGRGEAALKYLAAYLCRSPLHESQLEDAVAQTVTFRYRENGGEVKRRTGSGQAFVRRVLQHVLPKGFQRVRHYGWLGAATKMKWERILALLDWRAPTLGLPAPLPPPRGQVLVWIGVVARKPP